MAVWHVSQSGQNAICSVGWYVHCRLSLALLRTAVMCLRRSRSSYHRPVDALCKLPVVEGQGQDVFLYIQRYYLLLTYFNCLLILALSCLPTPFPVTHVLCFHLNTNSLLTYTLCVSASLVFSSVLPFLSCFGNNGILSCHCPLFLCHFCLCHYY